MFRFLPWKYAGWLPNHSICTGQSEPDLWWHSTALPKNRNHTRDLHHNRDHVSVHSITRRFTVSGDEILVGWLDCVDCRRKCSFSWDPASYELTFALRYFWYPCLLFHYTVWADDLSMPRLGERADTPQMLPRDLEITCGTFRLRTS